MNAQVAVAALAVGEDRVGKVKLSGLDFPAAGHGHGHGGFVSPGDMGRRIAGIVFHTHRARCGIQIGHAKAGTMTKRF